MSASSSSSISSAAIFSSATIGIPSSSVAESLAPASTTSASRAVVSHVAQDAMRQVREAASTQRGSSANLEQATRLLSTPEFIETLDQFSSLTPDQLALLHTHSTKSETEKVIGTIFTFMKEILGRVDSYSAQPPSDIPASLADTFTNSDYLGLGESLREVANGLAGVLLAIPNLGIPSEEMVPVPAVYSESQIDQSASSSSSPATSSSEVPTGQPHNELTDVLPTIPNLAFSSEEMVQPSAPALYSEGQMDQSASSSSIATSSSVSSSSSTTPSTIAGELRESMGVSPPQKQTFDDEEYISIIDIETGREEFVPKRSKK